MSLRKFVFTVVGGFAMLIAFGLFIQFVESLSAPRNAAAASSAAAAPASVAPSAEERARGAIAVAQEEVRGRLREPDTAAFRNAIVRQPASLKGLTVVCGEVNARNGFGGMTGFQRFMSMPGVGVADMEESTNSAAFARSWNEMCAEQ